MANVLNLSGVYYRWGRSAEWLLKEVNFTVETGEFAIITGQTGSGKTTLLELMNGLRKPAKGRIERFDDPALVTQKFSLYSELTVAENLEFISAINRSSVNLDALINRLELTAFRNVRADQLPMGLRKMLQIAAAMVSPVQLLMMDESDTGLDDRLHQKLFQLIREWVRSGKTAILFSVRAYPEIEGTAWKLENGSLVKTGSMTAEMKGEVG